MPWAKPIFPMLAIELQPDRSTIVAGEDLTVKAADLAPMAQAILEYESSHWSGEIPFAQATTRFARLPGLESNLTYRLRIGKRVSRDYHLRVLPIPQILEAKVTLEFPTYCDLPPESTDRIDLPLVALQGSRISIQLFGDSNTQHAELKWQDSTERLTCRGDTRFQWTCNQPGVRHGKLRLVSHDGVPSAEQPIQVVVHPDLPPTVQILDPSLPRLYLPREQELSIRFAVQDDWNVTQVEVFYQAISDQAEQPPHRQQASFERLPDMQEPHFQGQLFLTFHELPSDSVAARVWLRAVDNRPLEFGGHQIVDTDPLYVEFQPTAISAVHQRLQAEQDAIRQALETARKQLQQARATVDSQPSPPSDDSQNAIAASQQALENLAEQLEQANSDYEAQAQKARQMAQESLEDAAREMERLPRLKRPEDQQQARERAEQHIDRTIDRLADLERELTARAAELDLAARLEELARQQELLASEVHQPTSRVGSDAAQPSDADTMDQSTQPQPPAPQTKDSHPGEKNMAKEHAGPTDAPSTDWQQRQQQLADRVAELRENDASTEPESLLAQAERAEHLAEKATQLAEQLEQNLEEAADHSSREQQLEVVEELERAVEALAAQPSPDEEPQQAFEAARSHLANARQQLSKEQGQQNGESQKPTPASETLEHNSFENNSFETDPAKNSPPEKDPADSKLADDKPQPNAAQPNAAQPNEPTRASSPNQVEPNHMADSSADNSQQSDKPNGSEPKAAQPTGPSEEPPLPSPGPLEERPADLLRRAADSLQRACEACRQCANCQNPGGAGQGGKGKPMSVDEEPRSERREQLSEAQQKCQDAAQAPGRQQAEQHAKQAAEQLARLAEQAAQRSGLRKNCEKCRNPGQGDAHDSGAAGSSATGTKSVTDLPFERQTVRGETSSGWTRSKRPLQNGVLDGREGLVPESFRDIVADYFEALAKDQNSNGAGIGSAVNDESKQVVAPTNVPRSTTQTSDK